MKKFLLVLALTFSVMGCSAHNPPRLSPSFHDGPEDIRVPVQAESISSVTDRVKKSIVRITGNDPATNRELYICTGESIAPRKFLTAAHCVPEHLANSLGEEVQYQLEANGIRALAVKVDVAKDLAIVIVDLDKPAMTFRDEPIGFMELVHGIGFGHGLHFPLITNNFLLKHDSNLEVEGIWPGNVFMGAFIGGMSGGPIFDAAGLQVGVVQRGGQYIGYGVSVKTIREFLEE